MNLEVSRAPVGSFAIAVSRRLPRSPSRLVRVTPASARDTSRIPLADPGDALLIDERRAWSSDQAWEVANAIAHGVRTSCPEGTRLAVYAENAGEAVLAHLGGLRSGVSVVALSAQLSAGDAVDLLVRSSASMVLAGPGTAEKAERAVVMARDAGCDVQLLVWSTPEWDEWLAGSPPGPPSDDRPIKPSLLFTSGTTGRPKATELPPNVFPRRESWAEFVEATGANRFVGLGRHLVVAPLHHTGPLNAVRALAAGTPVGILGRFDPARTLEAIERWCIGSTTLVPTHMSRLLGLPPAQRRAADVSSLRLVFQTGSACPVDVKRAMIDWWGPVFLEAYGGTEVGVTCAITSEDWLEHPGSVGRAVAPYEVVVLDDDNHPVAPGTEGRLCFRDSTGRGIIYLDDPEGTARAHPQPAVVTLGEVGRVDPGGWVYVTDRVSDMVVTGGVNVYPAELEQVMISHPGVSDVAGVGVPDDDLGEVLVAMVVTGDHPTPDEAELLAWCQQRLSLYKCPRRVVFVDTLDRNDLGKLNKRALRQRLTA